MAVVQSSYRQMLGKADIGQIVSKSPYTIDSWICAISATAGLPYGRGVRRDSGSPHEAAVAGATYDDWEEVTQLAAAVDDNQVTFNVDDATVFDIGDRIRIDSEQSLVTGISLGNPNQLTVDRNSWETTAAAHSDNAPIDRIPSGPPEIRDFVGITCIDHTRGGGEPLPDQYRRGDMMAVCSRGIIAVQVDGPVKAGERVTMNVTTGQFSSKRPFRVSLIPSQAIVPRAVWETSAPINGVAYIRLFGLIQ